MKIKFLCTTLKKARFKSSFFDVITCFDVLEHDINLKTDIKELYKLLKPNGLLVVQCPNYKSYMTLICKDNWDWWSLPDHVFHFSHKNLIELLNNANFYILKERSWDPMNEFVRNIQGTIRINIKNILGKFISKFSYYFLILLWIISVKFKQFFKMGALTLIFAMKK